MAITVTVSDVKLCSLTGEFDLLTVEQIQSAIDDAIATLNEDAWCGRADQAAKNLAAHLLTLRKRGSTGMVGPLTGESADGVSRSFGASATGNKNDAYLNQTIFGQEYLRLLRMCPLSPLAASTKFGNLYNG